MYMLLFCFLLVLHENWYSSRVNAHSLSVLWYLVALIGSFSEKLKHFQ